MSESIQCKRCEGTGVWIAFDDNYRGVIEACDGCKQLTDAEAFRKVDALVYENKSAK